MEVIEKPKAELSLQQRAVAALGSAELEVNLIALATKHTDIVAVKDKTGRAQVHGAAMTLKNNRTAIKTTGKAAREDAAAFQKAIIAEENRLVAIIEPEEIRLFSLRDDFDAAEEAEKQAKIAAERKRTDDIKASIANIARMPLSAVDRDLAKISSLITHLESLEIGESFAEFQNEAKQAKDEALISLHGIYDTSKAAEEEAARQAEIRAAETVRIAAEREELAKLRKAQEDDAAELRKKLEAERAEIAKQQAANEAKAEAQRKIEEDKFAEQRAELAKQQDAIDAQRREQEELARVEQEKRDADAKAKANEEEKRLQDAADEAERQERAAAQAQKEAEDEQHMATVHADITAALIANQWLLGDAQILIDLIRTGKVPHVTITY